MIKPVRTDPDLSNSGQLHGGLPTQTLCLCHIERFSPFSQHGTVPGIGFRQQKIQTGAGIQIEVLPENAVVLERQLLYGQCGEHGSEQVAP